MDEDRDALVEMVRAQLAEQRSARRWRLFFRLALLGLFGAGVVMLASAPDGVLAPPAAGKHAALVKLEGPIFSNAGPASGSDAESVNSALRDAFENDDAQVVILEINTPGGSPVQSGYIADEILRLRKEYPDKPLYAVIADICASGGMYAAVAAGEVYADPGSLIGSVGVVLSGFGFVDAIDKLGVERRLMTAGENKGMLDPFLPEEPAQVAHAQKLLDQIHAQFIRRIKEGREGKLDERANLFDGLIWTGEEALKLGLIDGFGDVRYVAEEISGLDEVVEYRVRRPWWENLSANLASAVSTRLFQLLTQPTIY